MDVGEVYAQADFAHWLSPRLHFGLSISDCLWQEWSYRIMQTVFDVQPSKIGHQKFSHHFSRRLVTLCKAATSSFWMMNETVPRSHSSLVDVIKVAWGLNLTQRNNKRLVAPQGTPCFSPLTPDLAWEMMGWWRQGVADSLPESHSWFVPVSKGESTDHNVTIIRTVST